MAAVYAGNKHCIYFDCDSGVCNFSDSCKLIFYENAGCFYAFNFFAMPDDIVVELGFDFRVNGIYGNCEAVDSDFDDFIGTLCKQKSVCAHTFDELGEVAVYEFESFDGVVAGKSIARTCNSSHPDFRTDFQGLFDKGNRLSGLKNFGRYAGTILRIIKASFAKTAGNVTARTNRKMDTASCSLSLSKARM